MSYAGYVNGARLIGLGWDRVVPGLGSGKGRWRMEMEDSHPGSKSALGFAMSEASRTNLLDCILVRMVRVLQFERRLQPLHCIHVYLQAACLTSVLRYYDEIHIVSQKSIFSTRHS